MNLLSSNKIKCKLGINRHDFIPAFFSKRFYCCHIISKVPFWCSYFRFTSKLGSFNTCWIRFPIILIKYNIKYNCDYQFQRRTTTKWTVHRDQWRFFPLNQRKITHLPESRGRYNYCKYYACCVVPKNNYSVSLVTRLTLLWSDK